MNFKFVGYFMYSRETKNKPWLYIGHKLKGFLLVSCEYIKDRTNLKLVEWENYFDILNKFPCQIF